MISGIDYLNKKPVAIEIAGGRIKRISDGTNTEQLILPGLFDLQINGFAGVDFNGPDLTCEDLEKAVIALAKTGITGFMPTIITNSPKAIKDRLAFLRRFQEESKWGSFICGFHLEGPFISPQDGPRGAHPKEHVRKPDWALFQEFQEAAGSGIRIVTVSPEWEGAADFIAKCAASGVKVAIGHTAANTHEIQAAAEAGASLSTHLGNGAHPVLPRHPNYIWDQLAEDRLWLTLIADGFHLPPAVIKVFLEVKKEKAILVSDAVSFAGCKPGVYESLIGGKVELTEEGRLQMVSDPRLLAGSAAALLDTVEFMARTGLSTFEQAWEMASLRPYRFLYEESFGIEEGAPADLVLGRFCDGRFRVQTVIKNGEVIDL